MEDQHRIMEIINFLPDATWIIDCHGSVMAWNKVAEEMTGVKAEDIIGRGDYEYALAFYGVSRPVLIDLVITPNYEIEKGYKLFRRKGDMLEAEVFIPHFNKVGAYLWSKASRLLDADGNVVGAIETIRDITHHKKMQEIMLQSEKMVTIAGLAAGMAHEINNPLGVIAQDLQNMERRLSPTLPANIKVADELGLDLQLVENYLGQRNIPTFIDNMRTAVKRASNIMSSMLQFSSQSDSSHQKVQISDIIEKSIVLAANDYDLRKKYDFKNITITREYETDLLPVSLCVTDMERVIINILKNAAHAMFDANTKQPSLLIRTGQKNSYVVMEFLDNGPGMTEETRKRVFDPFFTTKDVGAGTGLGLSVAYTIITKNHGGEFSVDSIPGEGACFIVKLPVANKEL